MADHEPTRHHRRATACVDGVLGFVAKVLIAAACLFAWPTGAFSCTCRIAPYGFAAETGTFLPSNAKGLLWHGGGLKRDVGEDDFLVFQIFGEELQRKALTASDAGDGWKIVAPREAMDPGNMFMFIARHSRKATGPDAANLFNALKGQDKTDRKTARGHPGAVQVVVAAFPLKLEMPPKLVVENLEVGEVQVAAGASCSRKTLASLASLRLAPVRELAYFKDHLLYFTVVDGKEVRFSPNLCTFIPLGRSWREAGEDTLYSKCTDPGGKTGGLAAGAHKVQMRVVFPAAKDGPLNAESSAASFEFAACPK